MRWPSDPATSSYGGVHCQAGSLVWNRNSPMSRAKEGGDILHPACGRWWSAALTHTGIAGGDTGEVWRGPNSRIGPVRNPRFRHRAGSSQTASGQPDLLHGGSGIRGPFRMCHARAPSLLATKVRHISIVDPLIASFPAQESILWQPTLEEGGCFFSVLEAASCTGSFYLGLEEVKVIFCRHGLGVGRGVGRTLTLFTRRRGRDMTGELDAALRYLLGGDAGIWAGRWKGKKDGRRITLALFSFRMRWTGEDRGSFVSSVFLTRALVISWFRSKGGGERNTRLTMRPLTAVTGRDR